METIGTQNSYYFSKRLENDFETALKKTTDGLSHEGFGILTEIDVKATMEKKLNVAFRQYRILGACNPPFAKRALEAEDKIGTMLPCNVIVQELPDGAIEVAAVDPVASMAAVKNPSLQPIAAEIGEKLRRIIDRL